MEIFAELKDSNGRKMSTIEWHYKQGGLQVTFIIKINLDIILLTVVFLGWQFVGYKLTTANGIL
jgi:hypothetical protein